MRPVSPLRLLLWLKWTLVWRSYRSSRMKILGAILLLIAFLPLSIGAAWMIWYFSTNQPGLAPMIARDALTAIYLLWVVTPLLGFSLNESFDLTRLFVYPLSYRQIFFGSVLGSLLDLPVLLTLPTLGVLLGLFCASAGAWVVSVLLLTLFLLHTLALGQTITLALLGFLRSRRFRDITIVLFPLLGMGYYICQRVFFSQLDFLSPERLLDAPLWRAAGFLPPGWTAGALSAAANADWLTALLNLGLLTLAALATLWAAASALQSLYLGDRGPSVARSPEVLPQALPPAAGQSAAVPVLPAAGKVEPRWLTHLISPAAYAIASKEWVYLKREPMYKAMAVNVLYTLAAVGLPILTPLAGHGGGLGSLLAHKEWVMYGLAATLLLSGLPLLFNVFGGEGAAVTTLFSFPLPRRDMFLGKNLAHGGLLLCLCSAGLLLIAAITGQWQTFPTTLALAVTAIPVLLAAGNLVSVRLPHRMLVRGQRWSKGGASGMGGTEGCGYAFLYLLAYAAAFVLLIPACCAALLPGHFGISSLWFALSLPLALAYAVMLYLLLLEQAETWLITREPEIMARIVPEL